MTLEQLKKAVSDAKEAGDAPMLRFLAVELEPNGTAQGMAVRAYALGFADEINGYFVEAVDHFQRALALHHDLGDRTILAEVIFSLGNAHDKAGHKLNAMEQWQRARDLYEELDDQAAVASTTGKISAMHQQTGNYAQALELNRTALAQYEKLGDRAGVARTIGDIGTVFFYTGDYLKALEHWQHAVQVLDELGDMRSVARITGNMGNVHQSTGNYTQALELYHRALDLHTEINDLGSAANITRNLANVYRSTGSFALALEHFDRALARYEELGNNSGIAQTICSIGLVYYDTGDYPQSLMHLHRSLALHEELGDRSSTAHVTGLIGGVHIYAGDKALALDYLQRALSAHEELGERSSIARVTGNIGLVHSKNGDYPLALEYYNRALAMHQEIGNLASVARIRGSVIDALIQAESFDDAETVLSAMDEEQIDDPSVMITRENARAMIQRHHKNIDDAMQTLTSALAIAQEHSLPAQQAELHERLRDLCEPRNDLAGYIAHNREFMRITAEINGRDTAIKVAIQEKQRELDAVHKEHQQHMTVLHSTLPQHIADRVARGEKVNDQHDNTAVLFLDVTGFTTNSSQLDAGSVVDLLQKIFTTFDAICSRFNVMKIKTIGDAFMAVSFPSEHHVTDLAAAARAMMSSTFRWPHTSEPVQFRIGMHVGPVIAGILGTERIQYDVWGDTVNVASRMESTSTPGRIHVSETFASALTSEMAKERNGNTAVMKSDSVELDDHPKISNPYALFPRGGVEVKGKGTMNTYWLEGT